MESLAAYEDQPPRLAADPEAQADHGFVMREKVLLREDRTFLKPASRPRVTPAALSRTIAEAETWRPSSRTSCGSCTSAAWSISAPMPRASMSCCRAASARPISASTAPRDSLHVGHLLQIMMLRWLQQTGHKPIALMGGGTTKVGDPSGTRRERASCSTDEQIDANIAGIQPMLRRATSTFGDGPTDAMMVNNAEWLDELNYIPFLRDVGRHFSVNRMLTFD